MLSCVSVQQMSVMLQWHLTGQSVPKHQRTKGLATASEERYGTLRQANNNPDDIKITR